MSDIQIKLLNSKYWNLFVSIKCITIKYLLIYKFEKLEKWKL